MHTVIKTLICNSFLIQSNLKSPNTDGCLQTPWIIRTPLQKHTYSNILKILQPKKENFQIKNSDIFQISAQNIDCGYPLEPARRGVSNEYPQSMFF